MQHVATTLCSPTALAPGPFQAQSRTVANSISELLRSEYIQGEFMISTNDHSRKHSRWLLPAMIAATFLPAALPLRADEVTKWNEIATKASFNSGLPGVPLFEARVYAITFTAVHDALNQIDRRYSTYASAGQVVPGASPEAAVATAAHAVLVDQFNLLTAYGFAPQTSFLDTAYAASLALI